MTFKLVAKFFYTILLFIETIIVIRFLLKLIGASPDNDLVKNIYRISEHFVKPFFDIVTDTVVIGSFVIEITSLIALVVYMLLAFVAIELIKIFSKD